MIEWDTDIPPLEALLDEAAKAQRIIDHLLESDAPSNAS
jgi:uncharacterized protein (UPF0276 family)